MTFWIEKESVEITFFQKILKIKYSLYGSQTLIRPWMSIDRPPRISTGNVQGKQQQNMVDL